MRIRILGAAAGGGLPQWNCRCANCQAARAGAAEVRPRTQSSVAVSADGRSWFLLNVSADVRAQLGTFAGLWPPAGALRSTPIAGCILTDAEIDHTSGLLQLREGCTIRIWSTAIVKRWLHQYLPIGTILAPFADRPWSELALDAPCDLACPDGSASGLRVIAFESGREVPRFVSESPAEAIGSRIGLVLEDLATGGKLVYAPGVSEIGDSLCRAAQDASCLLVDGTFWSDDEPIAMGITKSTARQMGHAPIGGPDGTLAWLGHSPAQHRVYVHVNNTNPVLDERSAERREVERHGVRVALDGDEFTI